jgi:hypothetical protein
MTEEIDRKDLKIQALLEDISQLTTQYKNQIADLRVELTISENDKRNLESRVAELEEPDKADEKEDAKKEKAK